MTGDPVDPKTMAYAHLSDLEMASKVRMLMRHDLEFEGVCVGARDRIMFLSQSIKKLQEFMCHRGLNCYEKCECGLDELTDSIGLPRCDTFPT